MALTPKGEGMKVNSKWWVTLVGLLVLLASSSALAGSTAAKPRFQNSYVCVNLHDGLIKVISRRQHNRCATGWKRYKVSDIFGKGMRGAQGRFWEMHDELFEHQDHLSPPDLLGHAEALGLDVDRFAAELESHVHEPRVREDFMSGIRSGVNGTPTFFINNIRHNGGYDLPSLLEAVRSAAP